MPLDKTSLEQWMLNSMPFEPTETQRKTFHALSMMMVSEKPNPTLVINGFAGTGKTTLLRAFCDALSAFGVRTELMAPTGRAAKVLSLATGRTAKTIHRTIYRQCSADSGSDFDVSYNGHGGTVFIVDEASMIGDERVVMPDSDISVRWGGGCLLTDLLEFVFSQPGNRLVLVGDPDQLPPVGLTASPALDVESLRSHWLTVGRVWLTDVVRQESDSLILSNATSLRRMIDDNVPLEGLPHIEAAEGLDVEHVGGDNLLEKLEGSFSEYGVGETVLITRSNKRATYYSMGIRAKALYMEERLVKGDLLIVTRNNYLWSERAGIDFIANGDIVEVVNIYGYSEMYGLTYADVSVRLVDRADIDIDCKLLVDMLTADMTMTDPESGAQRMTTASEISQRLRKGAEDDYADYTNARKKALDMRNDEWLNALQVRYAYSLTCHKAQGGQWESVFVDVGFIPEGESENSLLRWIYTAVTRAKSKLYLINYKEGDDK